MSGERDDSDDRRDEASRPPPSGDSDLGPDTGELSPDDPDPDVLWRAQGAFVRALSDDDVPLPGRNRLDPVGGGADDSDGPLLPDLSAIAAALDGNRGDDSLLPDLSAIAEALTGRSAASDDHAPSGSAVPDDGLQAAIAHHRAGRIADAMTGYRGAVAERPDEAAAWTGLGALLLDTGHIEAAIVCLSRGLILEPRDGPAWSSLGDALRAAGRLEQAHRAQTRALDLSPGTARIHHAFGCIARDLGDLDDARRAFRRAELLGHAGPDLAVDAALTELLAGDLEAGFTGHEARWRLLENSPRRTDIPLWEGDAADGRRILVCHEQGLTDAIQFARYAPRLAAQGANVLLETPATLHGLLAASPAFADVELVDPDGPVPNADCRIPLLSLPARFPLDDASLANGVPYLDPGGAPEARADDAGSLLRIGLAWSGDAGAAAPGLAGLAGLLDLPVAGFQSLQTGPARAQLAETGLDAVVQDDTALTADCASMARAIAGLDLVIGVDSTAIHLAGAMGRPAWLLLPFAPDWRWRLHRVDSPWYPSLTLFRQTSPGDWDELVGRVRHALVQEARRRFGEPADA